MTLRPIRRKIECDIGHRVPTHGSKCANLHGHRYVVWAECEPIEDLHRSGEQTGMVLDFGFMKQVMTQEIDFYADHGLILWIKDPLLQYFTSFWEDGAMWQDALQKKGYLFRGGRTPHSKEEHAHSLHDMKLLILPVIPTAEELAKFWYEQMQTPMFKASKGFANLTSVIVEETPNSVAIYRPSS